MNGDIALDEAAPRSSGPKPISALTSVGLGMAAIALAVAGILALGFLRPPQSRTAVLTPPGSVFYASVFVDPSVGQRRALGELGEHSNLARVLPEGDLVAQAMNRFLETLGLEFSRDVEPWLGREAGLSLMPGPGGGLHLAAFFEADDPDLAANHLRSLPFETRERSHRDVHYRLGRRSPRGISGRWAFGLVDGFVVAASPRTAFEAAVDAARGPSLAGDASFSAILDSLPDDRLMAAYVSDPELARELALPPAAQALAAKLVAGEDAFTLSLHAEPDALVVEASEGDPVRLDAGILAALIQNFPVGR